MVFRVRVAFLAPFRLCIACVCRYDKTFFLRFEKRGKLKDQVKVLKKEIKEQEKNLAQAEKALEKADKEVSRRRDGAVDMQGQNSRPDLEMRNPCLRRRTLRHISATSLTHPIRTRVRVRLAPSLCAVEFGFGSLAARSSCFRPESARRGMSVRL